MPSKHFLSTCFLLVSTVAAMADDKKPRVREIEVAFATRDLPMGAVAKPAVIANADQFKAAFPAAKLREIIAAKVDFSKEKLLYFAWTGSGGDRLVPEMVEDTGVSIRFKYTAGLTDDVKAHYRLFAIAKDTPFTVKP